MKIPNSVAGKEIRCFNCRKQTHVPPLASLSEKSVVEQSVGSALPKLSNSVFQWLEPKVECLAPPFQPSPLMYLAFVVLLMPLLILHKPQNEYQREFRQLTESAQEFSSDPNRPIDFDTIASLYPGKKIPGSLLARDSKVHWFYGGVSLSFMIIFILLIFSRGSASLLRLSSAAGFTLLFGVIWLWIFHSLSYLVLKADEMTGTMAQLLPLFRTFAKGYFVAFLPVGAFWPNFLTFTVSIGLFQELFKALPLITQRRELGDSSSQTVCVWGLVSGMGFGVAEAIFYSAQFLNGMAPGGMYVLRFVSTVAFQAILTAISALLLSQVNRKLVSRSWALWTIATIFSVVPSAILHGLFDSLLKAEKAPAAVLVALISFLVVALLLETAKDDGEAEGVSEPSPALSDVLTADQSDLVEGIERAASTNAATEDE